MRTVAFSLSVILIFMIPWENAIIFPGLGTAIRIVGLLAGVVWCLAVILERKFRKPHLFHLVVFLFVFWNLISFFWSEAVPVTMVRIVTYLQLLVMILMLWDLFDTRSALKAGLQAYVLGAYVSIFMTISNFIAGITDLGRVTGSGLNQNSLALILVLGIPVAWYLALYGSDSKSKMMRVLNFTYIPLSILATLLTASRAGLITMMPAILFVLATFSRLKPLTRIFIYFVLILSLFAIYPLVPQSSFERLGTIFDSVAEGDIGGRFAIWVDGIRLFQENPVLGIGGGAFLEVSPFKTSVHSVYLSILVELGVIGFALFVIILGITVQQAWLQPKWESRLWVTVLLIWGIGVMAMTWEERKPTWLFLNLVVISANLPRPDNDVKLSATLAPQQNYG